MAGPSRSPRPIPGSSITTAGRGRRTGRNTSRRAGRSQRKNCPRRLPTSLNSGVRYLRICGGAMNKRTIQAATMAAFLAAAISGSVVTAHHSFAMYDQAKVVTVTGVVKQYVPQANHAEFHLY